MVLAGPPGKVPNPLLPWVNQVEEAHLVFVAAWLGAVGFSFEAFVCIGYQWLGRDSISSSKHLEKTGWFNFVMFGTADGIPAESLETMQAKVSKEKPTAPDHAVTTTKYASSK